jgi:hypothetical protein
MLKVTDDIQGLDMTFELSEKDCALLASAVKQEWFDLLQKLMETEVKRLNVKLLNTDGGNPSEILAAHAVAKGAGMFYVGFIKRLRELLEIEKYNSLAFGTLDNPEQPPYPDEFLAVEEEEN